ncbi:MAG TPA: hypothetical protein VIP09_02185 [Dehalococcoidia bacterium]
MRLLLGLVVALLLAACGGSSSVVAPEDNEAVVTAVPEDLGAVRVSCGIERWPVKTLTDADAAKVNLTPVLATIVKLSRFVKAPKNQKSRLSVEMDSYTVEGRLTGFKLEADSDIHAVIADAQGKVMIVEFPNPACARGSRVLAEITKARADFVALCGQPSPSFKSCPKNVRVTGVLFTDFLHGQTGVAPNGVELHPVTKIEALP